MSRESTNAFRDDIEKRIDYFRAEHQLTYAEALGVLTIIISDLLVEMREEEHGE